MFQSALSKNAADNGGLESVSESPENTSSLDEESSEKLSADRAQRHFTLNKFRIAVQKVIDQNKSAAGLKPNITISDEKYTIVTILPTHETKSIYLSQIFKYAVKLTIIRRRKKLAAGDSWNEFFYSVYSPERPTLENVRRRGSNRDDVKINLSEEVEKKLSSGQDLDKRVKDKLSPYRSSSSATGRFNEQGKRAFDNLSRLSADITRQRAREIRENKERQEPVAQQYLPKIHKQSLVVQKGRFHRPENQVSPDGTTPLSKFFYLPYMEISSNVNSK